MATRYEAAEARQDLESARAVWEASASGTEQAMSAYRIAKGCFQEGVSTQIELLDSRLRVVRASADRARADRARADRDLQVARLRFALLPSSPFSGGTASANTTPTPSAAPASEGASTKSPGPAAP